MKTRTICIVLVLAMLAVALGGCADTSGDANASPTTASPTVAPTQNAVGNTQAPVVEDLPLYPLEQPVTLTAFGAIYTPRTAGVIDSWDQHMGYIAAGEATNIWIEYECVATQAFAEQVMLRINSDDYPDMWNSVGNYYGSADQLLADNICVDLIPYLEEYAPDYMAVIEKYGLEKDIVSDNGVSTSFFTVQEQFSASGPIIRQDWMDELGLDAPETYDEYFDVLKKFQIEKGAEEAFMLPYTGIPAGDYLSSGYDVHLYSHRIQFTGNDGFYQIDGKTYFGYIEEGFVSYITMMNNWYNEGFISSDFVSQNDNGLTGDYKEKILTGVGGIAYFGRADLDSLMGLAEDDSYEIRAIQDAVKNKGDWTHLAGYRQSSLIETFSISTLCDNVEAAILWNNYWFTEEGTLLSNYGIENETFTYNSDGTISYTDMVLNNPDVTTNQAMYCYLLSFGVVDNTRENQMYSDRVAESAGIWSTNKDNTWKIPGRSSMTGAESDEYNLIFSDILTYISECVPKFIMGEMSLDRIDEFVNRIYEMDIERCIEIWDDTLDRYYAR